MSEILSNITVDSINQNITVNENAINFSPEDILLNVYTGAGPVAGGSNTNVQYSDNGTLAGSNSFTFNKTTNTTSITNLAVSNLANLGNSSNVKILGGTNSYFLQTDGTGNLTWAVYPGNIVGNAAPGGANTQIQFNDGGNNFGGSAGFTFDKTSNVVNMPGDLIVAGNITGNSSNANYAAYAGIVVNASQPNITSVGTLSALNVTGTVVANLFSGSANLLSNIPGPNIFGNISNLRTSDTTIHLGNNSGLTSQGGNAIAIGNYAGYTSQGIGAVSIGPNAGANLQQTYGIAIGRGAGETQQGVAAISIGESAGSNTQANGAIAIGQFAGISQQGENSIAIGVNAGAYSQANNSIVINATGANVNNSSLSNTFVVKPIRNANVANLLFYNPSSGEISYDLANSITSNVANYANYAGNVTLGNQSNITSVGTLTNLSVSGNANIGGIANIVGNIITTGTTTIQQAQEKVISNTTGSTGTVAFDLQSSAILYKTSDATANFTINFTNVAVSNGQSITCSYINTNGSNAYIPTAFQINGNSVVPLWSGNTGNASPGTVNGTDVYTFNIINTGSYKVFASRVGFV